MQTDAASPRTRDRVLLVSDWAVDPHVVVAAASRRDERRPATFALVVPAWLHGIDWAGDPFASTPCAERQLDAIRALLDAAGLRVERAVVGDPDPTSAIADALEEWPAEEVIVCARDHRLTPGPLRLARRVGRLTGLPVGRVRAR